MERWRSRSLTRRQLPRTFVLDGVRASISRRRTIQDFPPISLGLWTKDTNVNPQTTYSTGPSWAWRLHLRSNSFGRVRRNLWQLSTSAKMNLSEGLYAGSAARMIASITQRMLVVEVGRFGRGMPRDRIDRRPVVRNFPPSLRVKSPLISSLPRVTGRSGSCVA